MPAIEAETNTDRGHGPLLQEISGTLKRLKKFVS